jgi:hypothetical protein
MLAYHRHVCKRSGQLKSATSLANKPCADPTQYTVRLALQYHGTGEYHGRVQLPCLVRALGMFGAGAGHLLGLVCAASLIGDARPPVPNRRTRLSCGWPADKGCTPPGIWKKILVSSMRR